MTEIEFAIDPVCGMTIRIAEAPFVGEHAETTHYLCSSQCALRFEADAAAYVAAARLGLPGWGLTPHPENVVKQFRQKGDSPS